MSSMPHVLALFGHGVEELELVAPVDLLRRAGAVVTLASTEDTRLVCGRNDLRIEADCRLGDLDPQTAWDLVLVPGGPGVAALRANPRVRAVLQGQAAAGRPLAALCAAPLLLHDAGLLTGRAYTAHMSTAAELPAARPDPVVEDGLIVTGRGAGASILFGLVLVRRLFGQAKADEIAAGIAHPAPGA